MRRARTDRNPPAAPAAAGLRIDRLLWQLRLVRSRTAGTRLANAGHARINGRRVANAHQSVKAGDVLTLPTPHGPRAIRVLAIPARRGPAAEARACYEAIGESAEMRTARIKPDDIDARFSDA